MITGIIAGCVLWALLATAAYFDGATQLASKEDEIARRAAELAGLKASYQAAFGRLDEFQSTFSSITCEISDIQDSLLRITEHNVAPGKRGTIVAGMPRLDPDASGCRTTAAAQPAPSPPAGTDNGDTRRIIGSLQDGGKAEQQVLQQRLIQLGEALARLKASHGAFLQTSANITAVRIGELEKALNSVGVGARSVGIARGGPYGRGGPFIAAQPGQQVARDGIDPISLFNTHADRLDSLTAALRRIPLAAPLSDYEVTSPFGARNDPINAMTGIHEGVDLGAPSGTPVVATGDGQVVWAGWRDRYGVLVEIDHGMGLQTRYAHLARTVVTAGQKVSRGTILGFVGVTGRTTGPHLHYEVRKDDEPTNPMKFITAGEHVLTLE